MKRFLITTLVLVSCIEQDIVQPFTGDQVEYMLTDGTSKSWIRSDWKVDGQLQTNFDGCEDTLIWELKVSRDTIVGYQYTFDPVCILYDTLYLGKMVWGTDSLNFIRQGVTYFKKPLHIRPNTFSVSFEEEAAVHEYTFAPVEFGVLSRQVDYQLTDGVSPGDSLTWILTSRTENNIRQVIEDCADTIKWVFYRDNTSKINWTQLTPDESCASYSQLDMGNVTVSSDNGFFKNAFYVENGLLDSVVISSFTSTAFSGSYSIETDTGIVAYKVTSKLEK